MNRHFQFDNGSYWQVVWFFSMDDTMQKALIGTTEQPWFIEENSDNTGANYLNGICNFLSEGFLPDNPHATELRRIVSAISNHLEPEHWIFEKLVTTPEWRQARLAAAKLLSEENPPVRPPKKPFTIENLIRVDHFSHASKIRGKPRRWPLK